jgi:nucleoside phosphorylase
VAHDRCDILILAAFHPELAALRPALGEAMAGPIGNALVLGRIVGIGLSASAAGAATHIQNLKPRLVVVLGTCGAYVGSGLAVGDVVVARRIHLVDAAVARGLAEFPEPMSTAIDADVMTAKAIGMATGARIVDVATTLAVTVDGSTAADIALASGAHVEHLEAHGVAMACAAHGVPFGAVLGVANVVGPGARKEWRAHHRDASQAAGEAVLRWLNGGRCI